MLEDYLDADTPVREASIARFIAWLGAVSIPISLLLIPLIGLRLATDIAALLVAVVAYHVILLNALNRGWGTLWLPWLNTFIQTSVLLPIVCLDTLLRGPEYALAAPPLMLWGGLITLMAVRASRRLSIAAGALAAVEYLAVYALLIYPRLPSNTLIAFTPPFVALRAFFLFCCGLAAAVVTHHLLRKAEEALQAVRAQDLMSKYFLQRKIAQGGMGEIFQATYSPEGGFEKAVAVKRILPSLSADPKFVEMFLQEAKLGASLHHPNIVQVFDVGLFRGTYMLAMEWVEGVSLWRLAHSLGRPLPLGAVTFLAAEIAGALDYLHRRTAADGKPLRLVHCDVNPPNLLVSRNGEAKLGDFGIARAANRAAIEAESRGKAEYMAPEQLAGKPLDGRADLYGLGLTIYEALTGRTVRAADRNGHFLADPGRILPPSSLRPEVGNELDRCVMQLLEPDPAKRTQTGREARHQLTSLVGPVAPYPDGPELLARAVTEVMAALQPPSPGTATELQQAVTLDVALDPAATRSLRRRRPGQTQVS
jgi:eukaryotic-like serine/threonine-protein kinase